MEVATTKQPYEQIKDYLTEWGMKQNWLADKIDISEEHMSNILSGVYPLTEQNLKKINDTLGTEIK